MRHCMKSVQIRRFFWSVFGHFSHIEMIVKVNKIVIIIIINNNNNSNENDGSNE